MTGPTVATNGKSWIFVEAESHLVCGAEVVRLTPRAAAVLSILARNVGRTVSRDDLLAHVWEGLNVSPDLVREYVFDLRSALGDDARKPRYIETVRGRGFRLIGGVALAPGDGARPPEEERGERPEGVAPGLELDGDGYSEVTAVHCAVAGQPAPVGRAEAEAVHHLVERALRQAGAIVERHGGSVVQRLGDGILCLFGAPRPCEDHARRAVLAALELVGTTDGGKTPEAGAAVALSIGMASGTLLVGSPTGSDAARGYTARGQAVERARELQALAAPGEILLSDASHRRIAAEIRVEPLGRGANGAEALRLCGLADLRSGVPRPQLATAAPFVGRREEHAILVERFARARAGQPQIVAVVGPAGIGKSRLVEEFRASPGAEAMVLEGRCFPHESSTPYGPVRNLIRALGRSEPGGLGSLSARSGPDAGVLAELLGVLDLADGSAAPPGPGGRMHRGEVFRGLSDLVLGAARDRPVVLVIEDVHWIDATSAEWLAEFLATLRRSRLLVILTSREPAGIPLPPQAAVTQLFLPTLVDRESAALVRALLCDPETPEEVVGTVVARSGGNPFFLVELSLALAQHGEPVAEGVVPETVQSVVLSRVDRLDGTGKTILRICSVIGGEIPVPLLQSVAGLDDAALEACLLGLERGGFLTRDRVGGEPVLRFQHALLEEAVCQSLPLASLRLVHRRIVDALEEHLPQIAAIRPEVAARHHESASNTESAVLYLQRAARRSYDRSANVEAFRYAEKALALLVTLTDRAKREDLELQLLLTLAPVLAALRGYGADALGPVYARAATLCAGREDGEHWVKVHVGAWNYQWVRGELDKAGLTARRLVDHAERHPRNRFRAQAALGEILFHAGDLRAAFTELEAAIAARELAPEPLPVRARIPHVACLCYAAWSAWHLGRTAEGEARAAEAARLARTLGQAFSYTLCCALLAELHQFRLDVDACLAESQRAITLSREHRFPFWEGTALVNHGWAVARAGDFGRGHRLMRTGIRIFSDTGARIQMSCWTGMLADIHVHAGRFGEGIALVDEALGWVEATGERHYLSELHRLRAEALRGLGGNGRAEQALHAYGTAIEVAETQGAVMRVLRATAGLAGLLGEIGRAAEGRSLLDAALARPDAPASGQDVRQARTIREGL